MQLIVLAAGHGRRFGGLKQLAPVGPNGEAIMDFTARDARRAGFDGVALVVREEVRDELLDHIAQYWPKDLDVVPVVQGPVAGTTQAVSSAAPVVEGPFGVVNADDLYGPAAMEVLAGKLASLGPRTHAIVGYRLADTILNDAPVTRGVCETDDDGHLRQLVEQVVRRDGDGYEARDLGSNESQPTRRLAGDEVVSMNLWAFAHSVFADLDAALGAFDPATAPHQPGKAPELLLPEVVGSLVRNGRCTVEVEQTEGRCIGITHPDDLPVVRQIVALELDREGT
ncbi:MAG: NTP transferase domain-containing protein [Acidimicrobiales bacterium]